MWIEATMDENVQISVEWGVESFGNMAWSSTDGSYGRFSSLWGFSTLTSRVCGLVCISPHSE